MSAALYTVMLSDDPATLGADATRDDLVRYADALAAYLGAEYPADVAIAACLAPVLRSSAHGADDATALSIEFRLHEIEAGDEWIALLAGSR